MSRPVWLVLSGLPYFASRLLTVRSNVRSAESRRSMLLLRKRLSNLPRCIRIALRPFAVDLSSFATVFRIRIAAVFIVIPLQSCVVVVCTTHPTRKIYRLFPGGSTPSPKDFLHFAKNNPPEFPAGGCGCHSILQLRQFGDESLCRARLVQPIAAIVDC